MKLIDTLDTSDIFVILIAVALLGLFSIVLGFVFRRLKLPTVIGEISGGLILGPTVLGHFFPELYEQIFLGIQNEGKFLYIFYWIGLIMLMFISGFETQMDFKKENRRLAIYLLIGSSFIPFAVGYLCSGFFTDTFIGTLGDVTTFKILFAIGVAITSIPVISKIFVDLDIINTRFAGIMLSSATMEDLLEWLLLSISLGLSGSSYEFNKVIFLFGATIILIILSLLLLPQAMDKLKFLQSDKIPLIFCIIYVVIMSSLGINIIYSSLIAGIILRRCKSGVFNESMKSIKHVSVAFFTPIYFAIVGLRLDLVNNFSISRFLVFFVLACVVQTFSIIFTLLFIKLRKDAILNFAIAMNARGGPGIVLASVGYEFNIINIEFFTILVLTSILSSLMAGFWLRIQSKKGPEVFQKMYIDD